jgi:hypothetical protein
MVIVPSSKEKRFVNHTEDLSSKNEIYSKKHESGNDLEVVWAISKQTFNYIWLA